MQEAMGSQEPGLAETDNWGRTTLLGGKGKVWPWIAAMLVVLLVQVLVKKYFSGAQTRPKLPPGPPNLPLIGALLSLDPNLTLGFGKLAKKYGPIFYYRLGSHDVIVISSVNGAEEVLKTKDAQFADRPSTTLLRSFANHMTYGGQNISMADYNDRQKTLRKVCVSQFFTTSKLATYEKVRRHEGARMVEDIRSQIQDGDSGTRVNLTESLIIMATNIMCTLFLGRSYSDAVLSKTGQVVNLPKILERFCVLFPQLNLSDLFPSLEWLEPLDPRRLLDQYKDYNQLVKTTLGPIVEEHREARKEVEDYQDQDLVDVLLTLQETGTITEEAVLTCLDDMVGAGIDTNAHSSEWVLLELVKHPETLAKLQREIDDVVGKDRQVEESDFPNLPYLQAVVRETFRLHTPVPLLIPRFNKSPTTLGGYHVPANTTVFVNAYGIARDPLNWENPQEFNPERFMGSAPSGIANLAGKNYQLMPFGSGRRMCLGYNLGLLLVQRSVSSLVHAFEWRPPLGLTVDDISSVEEFSLVCHPKEPLCFSATPRLAPGIYTT